MLKADDFKNITIRGRVAYAICCLENVIEFYSFQKLDWNLLLDFLWRYPMAKNISNLADWHENEAECIAFCIMDELPYEKCGFEFITKDQYLNLKTLYQNTNKIIWDLTDRIAAIGTQSLYGGVRDGSPVTLDELNKVITQLKKENIPLPNFKDFEIFSYPQNPENDWIVWGEKIEPKLLIKVSRFILTNNTK